MSAYWKKLIVSAANKSRSDNLKLHIIRYVATSASKNTDSSVFYTEIETKILNTDSDPINTDRDPIIRVNRYNIANYSDLAMKK